MDDLTKQIEALPKPWPGQVWIHDVLKVVGPELERLRKEQHVWQTEWSRVLGRAERAEAALRDLVDPDPCYFDHNGFCQAHGYRPPCAHARARDLLAALDHPTDTPEERGYRFEVVDGPDGGPALVRIPTDTTGETEEP